MKHGRVAIAAVLLVALGTPGDAPAEARPIRWDQVIGAETGRLTAAQRERVAGLLRRESCYFGCSRTIARCLEANPPSRTARRLAGYVIRQVVEGRTDQEIHEGIQQRAQSAHPLQTATIDLTAAQCAGPADAPVTLVEYADFECPFCRQISPVLHRFVRQFAPNARVCFKNFPVRGHDRAIPAALAVLAAARQGRFWPMHDALYASAPRLDDEHILAAARRARVPDLDRFNRDRGDPAVRAQVEADKAEGLRNGVSGTPAIFFNGKEYLGQKNEQELRDRFEEELDLVRGQG